MKKYIGAALAAISALTLSSCEGLLNTNPTSSVSDQSIFTTVSGAQGALNGCYYLLNFYDSGGRADTEGYIAQLMTFSVDGQDIIVNGGWYGYDYNMWGHQRGDIFKAPALWIYYYDIINNLNSVITYTPNIEGGDEDAKDNILGQAYAMRGWAYFNLAQLFEHTYVLAKEKNMPGVPIYTEPTSDQTEGKPRGTIDETYNQILSDLNTAETLLDGKTRTAKNHFDQSVVRGILAHVYLVMNNWAKAEEYASLARAGYPLTTNEQWGQGFNDESVDSWMWCLLEDQENRLMGEGAYGPFALWANGIVRDGDEKWSFNCFYLNDKFADLFNESDIRGQQIHYDADLGLHKSDKFYDDQELCGDFPYMRSDELLLVESEAKARQGKTSESLALLNELQGMRGATLTTTTNQESLVEAILLERRKELYGEGYDWYDLIRCQKPMLREGNHSSFGGNTPLPARSWRYVYQIPTNEILNNPNINSDTYPTAGYGQNLFGDRSLVLE